MDQLLEAARSLKEAGATEITLCDGEKTMKVLFAPPAPPVFDLPAATPPETNDPEELAAWHRRQFEELHYGSS